MVYNIYCDESCHLEHDHQKVMGLGAVWCPLKERKLISEEIKAINVKHNLHPKFEIKWTKVSLAKIQYYIEILEYFFENNNLHFRGLIIPDKSKLDHSAHNQTHDEWYYKMYFNLLKVILSPDDRYNIYIDIKDTIGRNKVKKLRDVLCNNIFDFSRDIIKKVQQVKSHEINILQLTDLLLGALVYANRGEFKSAAKAKLVDLLKERTEYSLTKTTLLKENKFNILIWAGLNVVDDV